MSDEIRRSRGGRKKAPPITDIDRETREFVGVQVAAGFLGLSEEATLRRISRREIAGSNDGKVWRISVVSLRSYARRRSA